MAVEDTSDFQPQQRPKCFVVAEFGRTPDAVRRSKQVLRHLIEKTLSPRYEVRRADQIDDEGLITNQIIERLLDDDLVIADLTGLNPNVFYEIAVRHAARKPIVHLITKGVTIPFDVSNMRAVPYALDDPDLLEEAQQELRRKVAAIEASGYEAGSNPVSVARDVWLLRESERPEERATGDLLSAFHDLADEVRTMARRNAMDLGEPASDYRRTRAMSIDNAIFSLVEKNDYKLRVEQVASELNLAPAEVVESMERMQKQNGRSVWKQDDGTLTYIPF